jgi:twitching motility protein PilU
LDILPYLKLLIEKQGSDLFFSSGAQIKMKIEGNTVSVGKTILDQDMTRSAAFGIMNERQIQLFETNWEADFAIELPDKSNRFRVNVFRQRGEVAAILILAES